MKYIELTQGYVACVDDDLFENLNRYSWQAQIRPCGTVYGKRSVSIDAKRRSTHHLQRDVMGLEKYDMRKISYRDGNTLNCQRDNLFIADSSIVQLHRRKRRDDICIHFDPTSPMRPWRVLIIENRKQLRFGGFVTKNEAKQVRDNVLSDLYRKQGII